MRLSMNAIQNEFLENLYVYLTRGYYYKGQYGDNIRDTYHSTLSIMSKAFFILNETEATFEMILMLIAYV